MTSIEPERPSIVGPDGKKLNRSLPEVSEPTFVGYDSYAWGGLVRKLFQADYWEVFRSTPVNESFVDLDGCSATPWRREVMRGQVARHFYLTRANAVINDFETVFKKRDPLLHWRLVKMRQEKVQEVRGYISEKRLPRQILQAAVFELLFDPEHEVGIMTQREERLSEYFLERFQAFPARYLADVYEEGGRGGEGSWRSLFVDEAPVSLADILGSGSLAPEEVEAVVKSMAGNFAQQLAGRVQPAAKFISLDLEDVNSFRRTAYRNFPLEALKTKFFRNVLDPERHVVGDITDLSRFKDRSVSIYSMIEGFPFYADNFSDNGCIQIISEASRILKYGGKYIVFPWIARDRRDLGIFEDLLRSQGFRVEIRHKSKEDMIKDMGQRELTLVQRSPIFTDTQDMDTLPLLVATKMAA